MGAPGPVVRSGVQGGRNVRWDASRGDALSSTLTDQLTDARRRGFVGRASEIALFSAMLDSGSAAVLYVYGPGGIGKTSLLDRYAGMAQERGRQVIRLDGEDSGSDPAPVLAGVPRLVVLVDTAERLGPLDRWLRAELLPWLPADAVVVLAGRDQPLLSWRTDPGWRSILGTVRLGGLDPAEGRRMLRERGLPEPACDAALSFARGNPLALALAADVGPSVGGLAGGSIEALLSALLDSVPGPEHRAALEACSQVRFTTEPLLAAMLERADVHDVFGWLRRLSFVEHSTRGVRPHELVRDLLSAELRWRDPDRYALLHRRAGEYYQGRIGAADPGVLFDYAYLHRESPVLGPYLSWLNPVTDLAVTPMTAGEWPSLRAMLVAHEGEESARLADGWVSAQPSTVSVVRTSDGTPAGFVMVLFLDTLPEPRRGADPATAAAWRQVRDLGPALFVRYWLDAENYQSLSAVQTVITLHLVRLYLTTPGLAVSLLPCADPEYWAAACGYADMHRVAAADFTVGGRDYGVYCHDWQAVPPLAWLALLAGRETASGAPEPERREDAALSEAEFGQAVRDALRQLGRPDRLAASPLARASCAGDRSAERTIRDAAKVLEGSARDRRGYRALHHTYLQPAGTQQKAAELLDLPMSTYRRHLAEGVERLIAILWREERAARSSHGPSERKVD